MRYILMREKLIIFKTILVDFYTNTHRPGTRGHQWSHLFKKNSRFLYKSSRKVGKNTGTGGVSYGLHRFERGGFFLRWRHILVRISLK